ncbi:MAG: hypothetical protein ACK5VI_11235 [Opitutia bacterium]
MIRRLSVDDALVIRSFDADGEPVEIQVSARWNTRRSIQYRIQIPGDMDFEFDKVRISDGDDANTPHEDTDE